MIKWTINKIVKAIVWTITKIIKAIVILSVAFGTFTLLLITAFCSKNDKNNKNA